MTYEDLPEEWQEWLELTPLERFRQSELIFAQYLAMVGSLYPDPDPTSPFHDPEASSTGVAYGLIDALIESHYRALGGEPTSERVSFWLAESRTPERLIGLAQRLPDSGSDRSQAARRYFNHLKKRIP